ncbi:globin domain-containing protein [Streptomyces sp. NPDC086010]|uniref:globin domain-containing protein n=1 Tax=Streptomyces sp. NPDC086010 TaxID=3365745 RepID=UPI0037D234E8
MISAHARDAVADSLPAVTAAIQNIAARSYETLFEERPDLLHRLFNRHNQATGEQQAALANGLAGFAGLLVHKPYIDARTVLERIAHKHVSVGVRPDQYELVHRHLMMAFSTVLGAAATERVLAGWSEVYWAMARALAAREAQLSEKLGITPGEHWRSWLVVRRAREAHHVLSLLLEPADDWPDDTFTPGQYVSVAAPVDEDSFQIRQYSISSPPGGRRLRISVERQVREGRPPGDVSTYLHERAVLGSTILLSPPCGELTLPPDATEPLLLVSYGIGVTPFVSMLGDFAERGVRRPVTHVHIDRDVLHHPHRFETEEYLARLPEGRSHPVYDDLQWAPKGAVPTPFDFRELALPTDTTALLCGPSSFLQATRAALVNAGVRPHSIRYEVFGPDLWTAPS